MTYNLLYIEDQDPSSIIRSIEEDKQFKVKHLKPQCLEEVLSESKGVDLILLDFKLTEASETNMKVDAPAIASAFRTFGSDSQKDLPIVLISTRENITNYYKDFSSKDLFDFTTTKHYFLKSINNYKSKMISAIEAYSMIKSNTFDMCQCLGISTQKSEELDFRIDMNLNRDTIKEDIFAYSNFILQNIVRSVGVLIGEDILSARLGISTKSKDWSNLKQELESFKYTGIYSESYQRWWANDIQKWFEEKYEGKASLRRLNAKQRCEVIKVITSLKNLNPIDKIEKDNYKTKSSNFWTICKHTKKAIDPIDGFEIYERELYPWQEKEYLSFLGTSSDYYKYVKPADKKKVREIEKELSK
ncbi:hypothetical protein DMA11_22970 [Marinilabiliaceae bacterium JC017]|nr:hypothetical protein DMA11_22970 [Marinilabiliaceae bacterium JC017]